MQRKEIKEPLIWDLNVEVVTALSGLKTYLISFVRLKTIIKQIK